MSLDRRRSRQRTAVLRHQPHSEQPTQAQPNLTRNNLTKSTILKLGPLFLSCPQRAVKRGEGPKSKARSKDERPRRRVNSAEPEDSQRSPVQRWGSERRPAEPSGGGGLPSGQRGKGHTHRGKEKEHCEDGRRTKSEKETPKFPFKHVRAKKKETAQRHLLLDLFPFFCASAWIIERGIISHHRWSGQVHSFQKSGSCLSRWLPAPFCPTGVVQDAPFII